MMPPPPPNTSLTVAKVAGIALPAPALAPPLPAGFELPAPAPPIAGVPVFPAAPLRPAEFEPAELDVAAPAALTAPPVAPA